MSDSVRAQDIIDTPFTVYDEEKWFDENIAGPLKELLEQCHARGVPCMFLASIRQDQHGDHMTVRLAKTGDLGRTPSALLAARACVDPDLYEAADTVHSLAQVQHLRALKSKIRTAH